MDKIQQLRQIIDELHYENRKVEFSSVVERLTKRVTAMEQDVTDIKNILLDLRKQGKL
jgi:hypothetical protein